MKKILGSFLVLVTLITLSFTALNSNFLVRANFNNNSCGTFTYYFNHDDNNGRVDVDFEDNDNRIDVTGVNGWTVTKVELDVEDDGHSGFWQYGTGNLNNFNPNPGRDIDEARVTVTKSCPSPTSTATTRPSVTSTPTFVPTYIPTATAAASQTPFASLTPVPTIDPCEGECNEPTDTPTATSTPIATIFDVCQNIDGIQTSVPDGKHLDAGNINCVEFSPSGPSESNNTPSTVTNVQTPQVLGASTMAATGAFEESLFYSIFTLGTLLTSFGIMKNGKKKAFGFN